MIYFAVLLTLYFPYSFFLNKQLACLYPLILITLFATDTSKFRYLAIILILILSPFTYLKSAGMVRAHKNAAMQVDGYAQVESKLGEIRTYINDSKPVTCITVYREFDSIIPFNVFTGSLPVSTTKGYPILDASHFNNFKGSRYSDNFRSSGKIHIDYIISHSPITLDSVSLLTSNTIYYLYKNNRRVK